MSTHPPSAPKMRGMKGISSSWSSIRLQTAPEEAALRFLSLQLARSPWDSVPEDKRRGTCSSCPEKTSANIPRLGERSHQDLAFTWGSHAQFTSLETDTDTEWEQSNFHTVQE